MHFCYTFGLLQWANGQLRQLRYRFLIARISSWSRRVGLNQTLLQLFRWFKKNKPLNYCIEQINKLALSIYSYIALKQTSIFVFFGHPLACILLSCATARVFPIPVRPKIARSQNNQTSLAIVTQGSWFFGCGHAVDIAAWLNLWPPRGCAQARCHAGWPSRVT